MRISVELGLEKLLRDRRDLLKDKKVGLVCNQASVDHNLNHAADLLGSHPEINLTTLFGPQHGIRGEVQDNMVETDHTTDERTGLPVYSLYSETREPTAEMLKDVEVIVFDLQDVGCRIYTFIYTLANCMRAAARFDKKVVVCDRPNPINGSQTEGNVLDPNFASFVGQFPLPTRHGMTVGELALLFRDHFGLKCDLEVISMTGWSRKYWIDETDAPWVMPSPNMPTLDTATVFPGTVHLEGTQVSEGRGTTRPFEIIGAPYINSDELANQLKSYDIPGLYSRPCGFQPTFQKHAGKDCSGVQLHVTDRNAYKPVLAGVAIVKAIHELYPESFKWKEDAYEYEFDKNPFDIIAGGDGLRNSIENGQSLNDIEASWAPGLEEFKKVREGFLLY